MDVIQMLLMKCCNGWCVVLNHYSLGLYIESWLKSLVISGLPGLWELKYMNLIASVIVFVLTFLWFGRFCYNNQSITIEILGDKMTQWFFIEVHLLAGKLVSVVVIHSLVGSHANRHHTPNPQSGAAQPTQDEDHTSHEQSTRVPFGSPPGKGQEPLTITMIRARDKHLPPLDDPHCIKPSRWRQPPKVTSLIRSKTQSPSASRCNHSKQYTWMLSNLTEWWIKQARWVGEEWLGSLGCILK